MNAEPLANVIRGDIVESIHTGHLSVIDGAGKQIVSLGDPSMVTYYRSACKAFQAIPCITSGAADAFGFGEEEIALAAASHSGEPRHVEIAARMLEKIGISMSALKCGTHLPFSSAESKRMQRSGDRATELHNNCSGKHAAMLALAKHIGADLDTYDGPNHRVQKRIVRCIADFAEIDEAEVHVGIDGCGAPNFAVPLNAMAKSFINLITPSKFPEPIQKAAARIIEAMIKHPELIGGTERLDTLIMQAAPGRVISKVGADGVWLAAVLPNDRWPTGLGIALKVADGDDHRARPVVAVEILRHLGILPDDALPQLSPMQIKNRRGDAVGSVVSVKIA